MQTANQAPGSIVTVGIAGLGRAGWSIHAEHLALLADRFRVVAVSDPDPARRDEARARFGCRAYADYADMVRGGAIEVMVVASPSHLHAEHTTMALQAGMHVMAEKPMATGIAEADRMIAVARQAGRFLTVNHNYRNMPAFVKLREIVESGLLGRIIEIRMAWHGFYRRWDWQTLKEFGGGMLANYGSHAVDRALLFLGEAEPEVFCHMEHTPLYAGDAESHVKIILRARGKPLIDIELTNACAYPQEDWLVMGTQGGLSGSQRQLRWKSFDPQALPPRPLTREPTPDRSYNHEELPWQEEVYTPSGEDAWGYRKIWLDFYATLRHGAPLAITPESVRREVAILDACRLSSSAWG